MIIVTGGSTAGGPGGPGGTEYTTGQVVAAPVGGVILGWDGTNVRVVRTDATGVLRVDGSGVTQPISAASLPLPTGASTAANQATAIAALASIDTRLAGTLAIAGAVTQSGPWSVGQSGAWSVGVTGTVTVDGSAVTQPISAVSLPLPTGAATSALQTTGNASLSNIDGKLPAALVGGRLDVNIGASTSLAVTGPLTDAQLRATPVAVSDGGASLTVDGTVAVSSVAGSVAVTGTFWQATQPISAASLPLPTGAATETTLATLLTTTAFQARINTLGQKTMANSTPVVLASDQAVIPVSDNGGSLTVDGTVAVSSVGGTVTVSGTVTANAGTGTMTTKETRSTASSVTSVAGSATSVSLLASNANRLAATVYNDSTAILYLKLGATASTTSFTAKLYPEDYYEVPANYTGAIDGVWASATGSARITELT